MKFNTLLNAIVVVLPVVHSCNIASGFFVVSLCKTNPNPMEQISLLSLPIEDQLSIEDKIYNTFQKLKIGEHKVFGVELNKSKKFVCATMVKINDSHHNTLFLVTSQLNTFLDMLNEMKDDKQAVAEIIRALRNQGI